MSAKKATQETSQGFTDEERAAVKERAKELKAESRGARAKADGESDVLAKIAEMPEPDRAMAERIHAIVKASAPDLQARRCMPAVCSLLPPAAGRSPRPRARFLRHNRYSERADPLAALGRSHHGLCAERAGGSVQQQPLHQLSVHKREPGFRTAVHHDNLGDGRRGSRCCALGAAGLQNLVVGGDYDGNPADDEVAVAVSGTAAIRPALQLYDFPNKPPVGTLLDQVNVSGEPGTGLDLAGGRIHWFGADGDAIVVSANNRNAAFGGDYLLSVFTVVQNKLVLQSTYTDGANLNMMAMALGRFDNKITGDSFNPDLQLAAVLESDIYGDDGSILVFYTPQSCGARTIYVTAQLASGDVSNSVAIAHAPCAMVLPIIGKN